MQRWFAALVLFACASGLAHANAPLAKIGIVTGPASGTYIQVGNDLRGAAEAVGVAMEVKPSEGSLDNIERIVKEENVAFGIVQSDVLGFMRRSARPNLLRVAGRLRMVYPLHQEEVHVLARKEVRSFADLEGKRIAVGESASGSWLTATNLLRMMKIRVREVREQSPEEARRAVLDGSVDAMLFVGGKPVPLFEELMTSVDPALVAGRDRVHFLPLNDPRMLAEYASAAITSQDYALVTAPVPTIAVTAVLMSYDFSNKQSAAGRARCHNIAAIVQSLQDNIGWLRKYGHSKWQEVTLDANLGLWKRDACAKFAAKRSIVEDFHREALEQTAPASTASRATPASGRASAR